MQQFFALFKKEFGSYFNNYFACAAVLIYLLVSIGAAFNGSYADMHDPALYALFNLQLYVQALLIPALTMKLWADEYKTGTAEFLLTQPLDYRQPVLAKFTAAFSLAALMCLFLLPFIFVTSRQISLDWGNIVCSYFGLWLVIFTFCALGCLISALNKNVIIIYLLSVFLMVLCATVNITHFRAAYLNFLLAEIGIGDVLYFLMFGTAAIFLNVLVLKIRASSQKRKQSLFGGFCCLMLIGVAALSFSIYNLFPNKYDFTAHKIYTPQKISEDIVKSLEEPLSIDVYISRDSLRHKLEYGRYYEQVMRFLRKYSRLSEQKIKVRSTVVEPFSELENIVLNSDIYYEENSLGTKDYFGAVVRNDNEEGTAIKHFLATRSPYLEKDIDSALLKFTRRDLIKNIAVYFDVLQNLDDFQGFMLNLEEDYNVLSLPESIYQISPQIDLVILINPKDLQPAFEFAVDQYIMNGGKVIIFFDFLTSNQVEDVNNDTVSLVDFIKRCGVNFSENFTDHGQVVAEWVKSGQPLIIDKAVKYTIANDKLSVKPLIIDGEYIIGALLQGEFSSSFKQTTPLDNLLPEISRQRSQSLPSAQVALIGDVDILSDNNWLAENAPDINPYDAVYKSSNIELLRGLVDKMLDNTLYMDLPVRYQRQNIYSINEKTYNDIYNKHAAEFTRLNHDMFETQIALAANQARSQDKIGQLIQTDEVGQKVSELEMQTENLMYKMGREYSSALRGIFITRVFIVPIIITLLLCALIYCRNKKRKKKIREFMHE